MQLIRDRLLDFGRWHRQWPPACQHGVQKRRRQRDRSLRSVWTPEKHFKINCIFEKWHGNQHFKSQFRDKPRLEQSKICLWNWYNNTLCIFRLANYLAASDGVYINNTSQTTSECKFTGHLELGKTFWILEIKRREVVTGFMDLLGQAAPGPHTTLFSTVTADILTIRLQMYKTRTLDL